MEGEGPLDLVFDPDPDSSPSFWGIWMVMGVDGSRGGGAGGSGMYTFRGGFKGGAGRRASEEGFLEASVPFPFSGFEGPASLSL